jgi:hypothetical protein
MPFFWMHGVDDQFLNIETNGEIVYRNYRGSYSEAHRINGAPYRKPGDFRITAIRS